MTEKCYSMTANYCLWTANNYFGPEGSELAPNNETGDEGIIQ